MARLTRFEAEATGTFLAAIVNDEGFHTYGLSAVEKAAIKRAMDKMLSQALDTSGSVVHTPGMATTTKERS